MAFKLLVVCFALVAAVNCQKGWRNVGSGGASGGNYGGSSGGRYPPPQPSFGSGGSHGGNNPSFGGSRPGFGSGGSQGGNNPGFGGSRPGYGGGGSQGGNNPGFGGSRPGSGSGGSHGGNNPGPSFAIVSQSFGSNSDNWATEQTDAQELVGNSGAQNLHPKRTCRNVNSGKTSALCGNKNKDDNRCLYACVAGGFYHGMCGKSKECFCYRNNPEKGFIIEKRNPVMRKLKTRPSDDKVDAKTEQNPKEITEWFQSFNFYNNLKCDPCLCPAGCAIYGYFSGFCTPGAASECMCATAAKKPM
ncbi:unnamed protein product [Allacma fusca]|uniref:Uncharacterized protein n=2 Tax=Allacma fusca TaxID=39272 RepID=A0A8J2JQ69_9HEXA|nr:unnamed protein product [Allacma fusca]